MPLQYKFGEHAVINNEESLTEQEWKDSCDINKMLKNAARGVAINGSTSPQLYGEDDLTQDAVSHRINKQKLEASLQKHARETELNEEELKLIPESIKNKFGFKIKKQKQKQNDDKKLKQNDEIKTKTKNQNESQNISLPEAEKADGPPSS